MFARPLRATMLLVALFAAASNADARDKKFACPLPDQRTCMSTEEVYDRTGNGQDLEVVPVEEERRGRRNQRQPQPESIPVMQPAPSSGGQQYAAAPRAGVAVHGDTLAVASPAVRYEPSAAVPTAYAAPQATAYGVPQRQEMVVRTSRQEPFRAPAQVMRIYISPWEDEQGDLHMGGYVFSEIAPRKWNVGVRAASTTSGYRLLTLNAPARDAAQDGTTDSGDATAQVSRSE